MMNNYSDIEIKSLFYILESFNIKVNDNRIRKLLSISKTKDVNKKREIINLFESFNLKAKEYGFKNKNDLNYPIIVISFDKVIYLIKDNGKLFSKNINGKLNVFDINKLDKKSNILTFSKINLEKGKSIFRSSLSYLKPHNKNFIQLFFGFGVITILQIISPFLMQFLIDKGLTVENFDVVKIVLIGFVVVNVSRFLAEFIRSWLYLDIGTKISIELISDFLFKVLKLPIHFFNSRTTGDLLQRIEDNKRIENFLTKQITSFVFTISTLLVFLTILGFYNLKIFWVFVIGSVIYLLWVLFFWNLRKKLDVNLFKLRSKNQNILVHLLQGIQEIKLNDIEKEKRWEWEENQVELYEENKKMLVIGQLQDGGSLLINELKNSLIIYFSALLVMDGSISFGAMMAIQYILGQANVPLKGITGFAISYQMALLSFERIDSIVKTLPTNESNDLIKELPKNKTILFENVTFSYPDKSFFLRNINLKIKQGKVTAIMGTSGGGKTTILKLILKFYNPYKGNIFVGDINLKSINTQIWRKSCGIILQDSLLLNDTIINNIVMGNNEVDMNKIVEVTRKAQIFNFIENTAQGFNTLINHGGKGLSQGQIQRLLIARMMYKNPDIIILDEATNGLDIETENTILEEFKDFFIDKTVILIAHRLNTVKNADKIIVMKDGRILEWGSHSSLIEKEGFYYRAYYNKKKINSSSI